MDLRHLVLNAHDLRLFLETIEDPAWLEVMRSCGLISLPTPGDLWPVASMSAASCKVGSDAVAELLQYVLTEARGVCEG